MKLHSVIRVFWCAYVLLSFAPRSVLFVMRVIQEPSFASSLSENMNMLWWFRFSLALMIVPLAAISLFKYNWLFALVIALLLFGIANFVANGEFKSFRAPVAFSAISLAIIAWHRKLIIKPEFASEFD